jgi:hypothetical protein
VVVGRRLILFFVTIWALPRPTLVRVRIAYVRSSIYVAQPTLGSQFSAVPPLSHPLVAPLHSSISGYSSPLYRYISLKAHSTTDIQN